MNLYISIHKFIIIFNEKIIKMFHEILTKIKVLKKNKIVIQIQNTIILYKEITPKKLSVFKTF